MKIVLVLSLIAFSLAAYISWTTFTERELAGCGEQEAGCNEVIKTKWGRWMGIPVSYAGIFIYGALAAVSAASLKRATSTKWMILLFLAVLASTSGIWFMALQLFVIREICYFCTAIHLCGIIITILILRSIPRSDGRNKKELKSREDWVQKSKVIRTALLSLIGTGILIAGQFAKSENPSAPPPIAVQTPPPADQNPAEKTPAPPPPAAEPTAPQATGRKVSLLNGAMQLTVGEYPMLGKADAKYVYGVYLDYTCPACRQLHPFIADIVKKNPDQFAFIALPLPLDAECNRKVPSTSYQHRGACNFWRLAIALWNTSPEAFDQYEEYMFQFEFPPSPEEARSMADQLVGASTMEAALSDSRVPEMLRRGMQMFDLPQITRKSLPTLLTDKEAITGVAPAQSHILSLP